ncbi:MAG: hypothetical protein U0174_22890 [Polyangiaceae bacterium]
MSLEPVIRASAAHQINLHRLTGGIMFALGLMFSPAIFIEGKEDEPVARIVCAIGGVLLLIASVVYMRMKAASVRRLVELLIHHRDQLRSPVLIVRRRGGRIVGYGISVRDRENRHYMMQVSAEQDARAMLANLHP